MKKSLWKKVSSILLVVYSVFLILIWIIFFPTSIIGGLIIIFCGVIEIPSIRSIIIKKIPILTNKILFTASIILFLLTIILVSNKNENLAKIETTSSTNNIGKIEQLDKTTYEIIGTNHNQTVQNFYVLVKYPTFTVENVKIFIEKFRKEICTQACNIEIFDSKNIIPLLTKYPLEWPEYVKFADHFIAMSDFTDSSIPQIDSLYPFQDIQYKKFGGKNRKKEPIK